LPEGAPQLVKAIESVGRIGSSKTGTTAGVDLVIVVRGAVSIDGTVTQEERDSAERTYDPIWTNAFALLDYLEGQALANERIDLRFVHQEAHVAHLIAAPFAEAAHTLSGWRKRTDGRLCSRIAHYFFSCVVQQRTGFGLLELSRSRLSAPCSFLD